MSFGRENGMERYALSRILEWNGRRNRKPLVLMGARQVGKTWLMDAFAKKAYPQNTVYVNLMKMKALRKSLEGSDISPKAMLERIGVALDVDITPGKTLLVIDEIQESSNTLTSLKFFNEDLPELAVIAAGSLLGLAVGRSNDGENRGERGARGEKETPNEARGSFPVGKVNFLDVPPMCFTEFMRAAGKGRLAALLDEGDPKRSMPYAEELTDWLKRYLVVGGMPEAVGAYVETGNLREVREIQADILSAYDSDFVKHASAAMLPKIRLLWNSIPSQLAKENKKFVYTALKSGARAREYESALQWLDDAGMIKQVFRVGTPRLPLRAYYDFAAFKLYAHDVGLLGAMSELSPSVILDGNSLFTNFKGALTEQYVLQELLVSGFKPAYWTNDAGNAEVEFVVQGETSVYPVEAKAGINTQAKSLKVYRQLFAPPFVVRTALAGAQDGKETKDIPLFALGPSMRRLLGGVERRARR